MTDYRNIQGQSPPPKGGKRKVKLKRVYPDRPSLVDSGSQRVGMVRQSPVRYELVFSKQGVDIVNSDSGQRVNPETAIKITDGIMATQLANEKIEKMSGSDYTGMKRVSGEDVTNRLKAQTFPNRDGSVATSRNIYVAPEEPPVTYRALRGYSAPNVESRRTAPSNIYGDPSGRAISDQETMNPDELALERRLQAEHDNFNPAEEGKRTNFGYDIEGDIMMTPPGGGMAYGGMVTTPKKRKKKKMYGGKMKKYAKGGGIRKPKYS